MAGILKGIRVIDCTTMVAAPTAAAMLGDLGADVIKIEESNVGDPLRGMRAVWGRPMILQPSGRHGMFEAVNRNKRGVTIDLKKPAGREIIYHLIEKSDVFLTSLRTSTVERYGLDYETLREHNPKLIYGYSNAFGARGPDADQPGVDLTIGARSGSMTLLGSSTNPVNAPLHDIVAGITLFHGLIAALLARERYGVGQKVTCSGMRSMMAFFDLLISQFIYGLPPAPQPERTKVKNPAYNFYKCKDDNWLALALFWDKQWAPFCKAIGMPELIDDPRSRDAAARAENCEELIRLLDNLFATKPYKEWERALMQMEEAVVSHVNTIADLFSDPQVLANEDIVEWDHPVFGPIKRVASPVAFSETPATFRLAAPEVGQHTEEVLMEVLGYTWDKIGKLREQGVI